MADNTIYNPRQMYNSQFKKRFEEESNNYFDELVSQGKVNEEENALHVKKYNEETSKLNKLEKANKSLKSKRGWMIFLEILMIILAVVAIVIAVLNIDSMWWLIIIGALLFIGGLALMFTVNKSLKNKIQEQEQLISQQKEVVNKALQTCYDDLAGLNSLYDWNMVHKIVKKVTPILDIDQYFTTQRLSFLVEKYGLVEEYSKFRSVVGVTSGQIEGNPFAIVKTLDREIINKTYEGTLVIHWTTTHTDSQGHLVTEHHSETLHAYVTKPAPTFYNTTELIYGNEAAPHLSFDRDPTRAHTLDEKGQKKYVEKRKKEIQKYAEKAIKAGKNFTPMGNDEFDAFFGADNRDNEVEFRLLFTPLAQKNELDLIKNPDPYGDDFYFSKKKMINVIASGHSQSFNYNVNPNYFINYDVKKARENFVGYMNEYFRSLYFDLAPLLSIPLYQMNKPHEYIYKDVYPTYITNYEHEVLANKLDKDYFMPETANRSLPLLLKQTASMRKETGDEVQIKSSSFETYDRVDYVSTLGGDGHFHEVPVPWVEYIEVETSKVISTAYIGSSANEFSSTSNAEKQVGKGNYHYERGLIGIASQYSPQLNNYLKQLVDRYKIK